MATIFNDGDKVTKEWLNKVSVTNTDACCDATTPEQLRTCIGAAADGDTVEEAPSNDKIYGRKNAQWVDVDPSGTAFSHASTTGRDAADSHPQSAITGLTTHVTTVTNHIGDDGIHFKLYSGTTDPDPALGEEGDLYIKEESNARAAMTSLELHAAGLGTDGERAVTVGTNADNDGGGGVWYWDSTVLESAANFATIINPRVDFSLALQGSVAASGDEQSGCWVRSYQAGKTKPEWAGAIADGVTDNTDAVQHLIDTFQGVIEFGEGTYLGNYSLPSYTHFVGCGITKTTLKNFSDDHVIQSAPEKVLEISIKDMMVMNNSLVNTTDCINLTAAVEKLDRVELHNIYAKIAARHGILVSGAAGAYAQQVVMTGIIKTDQTGSEGVAFKDSCIECSIENMMIYRAGQASDIGGTAFYIGTNGNGQPSNIHIGKMTASLHSSTYQGNNPNSVHINEARNITISNANLEMNSLSGMLNVAETSFLRIEGAADTSGINVVNAKFQAGESIDVGIRVTRVRGVKISGYMWAGGATIGLGVKETSSVLGHIRNMDISGLYFDSSVSDGGTGYRNRSRYALDAGKKFADHTTINTFDASPAAEITSMSNYTHGREYTFMAENDGNATLEEADFFLNGALFKLSKPQWRAKVAGETITLRCQHFNDTSVEFIEVARSHPSYEGTVEPATGYWYVGEKQYNSAWIGSGTKGWVCTTAGYAGTAVFATFS